VPYNSNSDLQSGSKAKQSKAKQTIMTKKGGGHHGGGGGRRRKNSKDISDDESSDVDNNDSIASCSPTDTTKGMSFADRRDFQRKAAADKRRQKMKVCVKLKSLFFLPSDFFFFVF
jgi:hypothetical protein